jgi:hypothetical protein
VDDTTETTVSGTATIEGVTPSRARAPSLWSRLTMTVTVDGDGDGDGDGDVTASISPG